MPENLILRWRACQIQATPPPIPQEIQPPCVQTTNSRGNTSCSRSYFCVKGRISLTCGVWNWAKRATGCLSEGKVRQPVGSDSYNEYTVCDPLLVRNDFTSSPDEYREETEWGGREAWDGRVCQQRRNRMLRLPLEAFQGSCRGTQSLLCSPGWSETIKNLQFNLCC